MAGGRGVSYEATMSALGQKQTSAHFQSMSALPPKADIGTHSWDVRFVPEADMIRSKEQKRLYAGETRGATIAPRISQHR